MFFNDSSSTETDRNKTKETERCRRHWEFDKKRFAAG